MLFPGLHCFSLQPLLSQSNLSILSVSLCHPLSIVCTAKFYLSGPPLSTLSTSVQSCVHTRWTNTFLSSQTLALQHLIAAHLSIFPSYIVMLFIYVHICKCECLKMFVALIRKYVHLVWTPLLNSNSKSLNVYQAYLVLCLLPVAAQDLAVPRKLVAHLKKRVILLCHDKPDIKKRCAVSEENQKGQFLKSLLFYYLL